MTERLKLEVASTREAEYSSLGLFFRAKHLLKQFANVSIEGDLGYGKSQYQLFVTYSTYQDWDKALKNTFFFTLSPLAKKMKELASIGRPAPLLSIDDLGALYNPYAQWQKGGFKIQAAIASIQILARESTHGLIFSSPHEDLLKILRKFVTHITNIRWYRYYQGVMLKWNERAAVTYRLLRYKSWGQERYRLKRKFAEVFTINKTVPKDVLKDYYEQRHENAIPIIERSADQLEDFEINMLLGDEGKLRQEAMKALELRKQGLSYEDIAIELFKRPYHEKARRLVRFAEKLVEKEQKNRGELSTFPFDS
jgi:hypothetical protein